MRRVSLEIRKEYDCDVLVVGGGVSGIAAAVSAARGGARVLLCESGGMLGGTATKGLVGPFMTCYDKEAKTQIIRGFFSEFVDRMIAEGGAIAPSECLRGGESVNGYRPLGHKGVTPFSTECFKRVADALCVEAGVRLLFHTTLIACECENDAIVAAYVATAEGVDRITAKVFVDATGSASLAAKAGAETFRDVAQVNSTFFTVTGVNKKELDAYMSEHIEMRERYFMDAIDRAKLRGEFDSGTQKLRMFEGVDGVWTVNMAQLNEVIDELDVESLTDAEITQRKQILQLMEFLRKNIVGLENIRLCETASELGIRESRRMLGKTVLTGEDIAASRYADAQIAVCANSVDIHRESWGEYQTYSSKKNYYIPLSCLVSKDRRNLLAAGKCLSADTYAFSAVRVMPPCFAMGEAVGILASLGVEKRCDLCDVPTSEVQKRILKNGGYLEL